MKIFDCREHKLRFTMQEIQHTKHKATQTASWQKDKTVQVYQQTKQDAQRHTTDKKKGDDQVHFQ